jgi:hypothetical protein
MVIYERLFRWKYFKILWLKEMIAISKVWNLIKNIHFNGYFEP